MNMFPTEYIIHDKRFVPFIDHHLIQERIAELANRLSEQYPIGEEMPVFLPVLNGAYFFMAHLISQLHIPYQIDFIKLSSYGNSLQSSGQVRCMLEPSLPIVNRKVIILEDIIETGLSSDNLLGYAQQQGVSSAFLATLFFKSDCFQGQQQPNWVGFDIPPAFVVGCGMDYDNEGRHLSSLYCLQMD
jgi:hypoxanthine phosphoribosyltransferase